MLSKISSGAKSADRSFRVQTKDPQIEDWPEFVNFTKRVSSTIQSNFLVKTSPLKFSSAKSSMVSFWSTCIQRVNLPDADMPILGQRLFLRRFPFGQSWVIDGFCSKYSARSALTHHGFMSFRVESCCLSLLSLCWCCASHCAGLTNKCTAHPEASTKRDRIKHLLG